MTIKETWFNKQRHPSALSERQYSLFMMHCSESVCSCWSCSRWVSLWFRECSYIKLFGQVVCSPSPLCPFCIGQYVGHPLNHNDLRFKSTLSTPFARCVIPGWLSSVTLPLSLTLSRYIERREQKQNPRCVSA